MALGDRLPSRLRLGIKRRGAGAAERDVYPTRYRANTPSDLARAVAEGGLEPVAVEYVATLHRYAARVAAARAGAPAVVRAGAAGGAALDDRRLVPPALNVRIL